MAERDQHVMLRRRLRNDNQNAVCNVCLSELSETVIERKRPL